jgi:hypothetical protein
MSRALTFAIIWLVTFAGAAAAAEIIVQNDTLPPGTPVNGGPEAPDPPVPNVLRIGAVLTMPLDGTIVGVQVLWGSINGGAAPQQHSAINISFDTFGQNPSVPLARIESPTFIDGGANEFRFLDPGTDLQPVAVPVVSGQNVLVDVEFTESLLGGPSAPGILADAAITLERNAFYFPPIVQVWGDWAIVASAGDLAIRAIVVPVPEPSAIVLALLGAAGLAAIGRRARCCTAYTSSCTT